MRAPLVTLASALWAFTLGHPLTAADQAGGTTQQPSPSAQATDVYHITAVRAAPGKAQDLLKLLTAPPSGPSSIPEPDFEVLFQHRDGYEWDFLGVQHMGQSMTMRPPATPAGPASAATPFSQLVAWHADSFAAGPALAEFRRVLALEGSSANERAVYVITDYLPAAGHRAELRQLLDQIAGEAPGRSVTLTHMEGAPWTYLTVQRYDSWHQLADETEPSTSTTSSASAGRGQSPRFFQLREHMALHHDTYASAVAVRSAK
jgi:hypothetical protein